MAAVAIAVCVLPLAGASGGNRAVALPVGPKVCSRLHWRREGYSRLPTRIKNAHTLDAHPKTRKLLQRPHSQRAPVLSPAPRTALSLFSQRPKGHLKQFGSWGPPSWKVEEFSPSELTSERFWEGYINTKTPVVIRGETLGWPAYAKWTDEYLTSKHGAMEVIVEHKFENAGVDKAKTRLGDYLRRHGVGVGLSSGQRYVVSELPEPMYEDVSVPLCLRCGNVGDQLVEMDLWVSNGGTSAIMHRDPNNQLNCVVRDSKKWTLIDAKYVPELPFVWEDGVPPVHNSGGTVAFDFESVDLERYPELVDIPYAQVVLEEGDCIFVPGSYPHHVHSPGVGWSSAPDAPKKRNVQVSFLFRGPTAISVGTSSEVPPEPFEPTGCDRVPTEAGSLHPLSEHPVAWRFPGTGPSSMGGANPRLIKSGVVKSVTSAVQARVQRHERAHDQDGGDSASPPPLLLSRDEWADICATAVRDHEADGLPATKGVPKHDFGAIADAIDIALRDPELNVGPSSDWMPKAVAATYDEPVNGPRDTHVIPGLRNAVLSRLYDQALAFCAGVGSEGAADGSGLDKATPDAWLDALRAVPPIEILHRLLLINTAGSIADCARFAVHVREEGGAYYATEWGDDDGDGDGDGEEKEGDHDGGASDRDEL